MKTLLYIASRFSKLCSLFSKLCPHILLTSSSNDLKANLDENLFLVFQSVGYDEDFKLIDVRLALGIACCALAAGAFYIDKHMDFRESVNLTAALVAVYGVCASLLWLWKTFFEKNIKYVGYKRLAKGTPEKLVFKLTSKKTENLYEYELSVGERSAKGAIEFNKVFNKNGFLEYEEFKELLATEVKKLSKKDE